MTRVKLKEQYISYLPLLQILNNISIIMLLYTFNIISLILDMRKSDYVILHLPNGLSYLLRNGLNRAYCSVSARLKCQF